MNNGNNEIDLMNTGATIKSHTPATVNDCVPATFLNIKNRCFMCWGGTDNFIFDGASTTPVVYDVGIDPPPTAATYTFGDTAQYYVFVTAGGTRVTLLNAADTLDPAVKSVSIGGQTYLTLQPTPTDLGPFATGASSTGTSGTPTLTLNGATLPVRDYNGLTLTVDGNPYIIISYTPSGPNTTVTLQPNLSTSPVTSSWAVTGRQIILATPYLGATTSVVTIGFFIITSDTVATAFSGPLSWVGQPGPHYAYAYYDDPGFNEFASLSERRSRRRRSSPDCRGGSLGPTRYVGCKIKLLPLGDTYTIASYTQLGSDTLVTTVEVLTAVYSSVSYELSGTLFAYGSGHVSNISPQTFVTEQDQSFVTVVLNDIIPSGSADQARFNKILIFRTVLVSGPGALWALDFSVGTIDNVGSTPLTFTDTYDDSFLLQTSDTGVSFQAPTTKNNEPPPFAHQGYWDGRIWGNPVDDPSAVLFSGDIIQIPFGVAEECYPSSNILRISSDDGRVTGMSLMGPLLVITTERYAYYIVGGPDSNTYQFKRFSTLMQGVGDYQMTEFAGQTTDDSDALIYLGKDKRFYLTAPSVGNIPVSDPIQDVLNQLVTNNYTIAESPTSPFQGINI